MCRLYIYARTQRPLKKQPGGRFQAHFSPLGCCSYRKNALCVHDDAPFFGYSVVNCAGRAEQARANAFLDYIFESPLCGEHVGIVTPREEKESASNSQRFCFFFERLFIVRLSWVSSGYGVLGTCKRRIAHYRGGVTVISLRLARVCAGY